MLKIELSGRDLRNKISDSLAFWIRSPPIDPDLSNKKMY